MAPRVGPRVAPLPASPRQSGGRGRVQGRGGLVGLGFVALLCGCPHHASSSAGGEGGVDAAPQADAAVPGDPRVEELWTRAKEGEADDLARLADREGSAGLEERAKDPAYRLTALRAVGFVRALDPLPWLADAATNGTDPEADAALASAAQLASEPRRSVDPEDALELRQGCATLLALAKDTKRPRARRVGALRVIRMLDDRGCAKPGDVPTDLDDK